MNVTKGEDAPIRLAIVGCGWIAGVHADAARKTGGRVKIVACVDKNPEAAHLFAAKHGCHSSHDSIESMLEVEKLDGVIICTWPNLHHEHIYQLMEGGIRHILCEKALTVRAEDASEVLRRTRAAGVTVLEGFMFRYHPMYRKLKEMSRHIGPIDTIRAGFHEYDPEIEDMNDSSRNWRQVKEAGGGVAYDYTCYSIHAATDLAGSLPAAVSFHGEIGRYGTLVRLHGHIVYENQIVALIHSSRRANISKEVEVCAANESLELPLAYGFTVPASVKLRRRLGNTNVTLRDEFVDMPEMPGGHDDHISARRQLEHFADIIGGAEPHIDLAETVVNMFIIAAMVESAETRRTVDVKIPDDVRAAWLAGRSRLAQ
jgi:xylose dehydrogenase (NAD/NADP)